MLLALFLAVLTIQPQSGNKSAAAPGSAAVQLVDITARTGIRFSHTSTPDARYIVESMSGGVALIDYDQDGYPDIYFTNAGSVAMALAGKKAQSALYHNNHDGTFTDVTEKSGTGYPCWAMGAVVGDYNHDGRPDLLVTCFGGVVLYRNNGDGTFTDVTKQVGLGGDTGWATGASFGDYDGDGWPDLFVSHYVDFHLDDLPTFGSKKTCRYHDVAVQCGPRGLKGTGDALYRNRGDGTFVEVAKQAGVDDPHGYFGLTAVWAHLTSEDGPPNLFVANDGEPNFLYVNDGHGRFTDVAYPSGVAVNQDGTEQANMGVALGDYLHSGRFSIAISHFSEEYATLYRNDGRVNFTDVSYPSGIARSTRPYVGWGDAFLDLDNGGWLDFVLVNGHVYPQVGASGITSYREPKLVFANRHDGTFADVSKQSGAAVQIPQVSRGVAVGDLFNDGHLEVVVENLEGAPMLLRAESNQQNHWISVQLRGSKGDLLALNAQVTVTAASLVQKDEVRSGGSYLSQSDLRLHFGLGTHDHVDKLTIAWPSGAKEAISNLTADRVYTIEEGRGVISSKAAAGVASIDRK